MSVKNIFFTDDNQLDFMIGNEEVSKIFCGDILVWERGEDYGNRDRIEYVKGFTSPVNGVLKTTEYEAGDISDECEMATTANQSTAYGNCTVGFKPRGECLLLAVVSTWGGIGESGEADLCNQKLLNLGFEPLTEPISLYPSAGAETSQFVLRAYIKHSNGSLVYLEGTSNISPKTRYRDINFIALYGASSVDIIKSEHPDYDTTYSFNDGRDNTWYGFTTPASNNKPRIYCYANVTSGSQKYISEGVPVSGAPVEYTATIEPYETMVIGTGCYVCYDNTSHNAIKWWVDSKTGDSTGYVPITSREHAVIVLDVNYD